VCSSTSPQSATESRFPVRWGCTASERRGNNLKDSKDFYLKTKAIIWPGLSYVPYSLNSGGTICTKKGARLKRGYRCTEKGRAHVRQSRQIRQSRPDYGLGFQVKGVPCSLESGRGLTCCWICRIQLRMLLNDCSSVTFSRVEGLQSGFRVLAVACSKGPGYFVNLSRF